ncbi:hypothetical protein ACFO9K_16180 [Halorussus aquaticus]|uniref:DUF1102 domain-containing protein n=1 Tax=Halorussus aquaticus TaxID=2953748 RepID=A0ABD5Q5H8_9EURY
MSGERTVTVKTADDNNAFLALYEQGEGRRSYKDGDVVGFDIPSPDEDEYPEGAPTDPDGLGTDSVYRFGKDAAGDDKGLFRIENQGTQAVKVYSEASSTDEQPSITAFDVETGRRLTEGTPSDLLGVGDSLYCGLEIDTHGVGVRDEEYEATLTIVAEAPEE